MAANMEARMAKKRKAAKRSLIKPHKGDSRYVRRTKGKFTKSQDDVGRSLAADRRTKAKTAAKSGQGDRGDQKRPRKTARKKR
jgi:hypothetical protein